jgi:hypothetical protein
MARMLAVLMAAVLTVALVGLAAADPRNTKADGNLVRIPAPQDETTDAYGQPAPADPMNPPLPTPADQMYVFWFVGKVISYPVDIAESYVSQAWDRWNKKPVMVPASAPADNPFTAIERGQIPPAPPVVGSSASR